MLALDEEVDFIEYHRYLRDQSDGDLFDIIAHLDPINCPRRAEAAQRELMRRQILVGTHYQHSDNVWRKFFMLVVAVFTAALLLGAIMSPDEAVSPQPLPSLDVQTGGQFLQISASPVSGGEQMTASIIGVYYGQIFENGLRDFVFYASQSGVLLILVLLTLWKFFAVLREKSEMNPLRHELKIMIAVALSCELLLLITAGWNSLSVLTNGGYPINGGFFARAITVLAPWG